MPSGDDPLWDLYAATVITVEATGAPVAGTADPAPLPLPAPVFVVTAHNPASVPQPAETNDRAQGRLVAALAARGLTAVRVTGSSPDGTWREPSLAVSGVSRAVVGALAREFGQHGFFELDEREVRVVAADGRVMRTVPR